MLVLARCLKSSLAGDFRDAPNICSMWEDIRHGCRKFLECIILLKKIRRSDEDKVVQAQLLSIGDDQSNIFKKIAIIVRSCSSKRAFRYAVNKKYRRIKKRDGLEYNAHKDSAI